MLDQITASFRRWTGSFLPGAGSAGQSLVRLGNGPDNAVSLAQRDIGSLRGVTMAAADTSACACPDACERDHANE